MTTNVTRHDQHIICKGWLLVGVLLAGMIATPAAAASAGAASGSSSSGRADPSSFIDIPLRFFQDVISPVDGPRCHSYPTCSTYARQSVAEHGPLMGWIMTCDRLMRDGRDDNRLLPRIHVGGDDYADDPVRSNDFWWYKRP